MEPRPLKAHMNTRFLLGWVFTVVWMTLSPGIGWSAMNLSGIQQMPGESATLLPNGAILLLGGQEEKEMRQAARIWDPQTQAMIALSLIPPGGASVAFSHNAA